MNPSDPSATDHPEFQADLATFFDWPPREQFMDLPNDEAIALFRRQLRILRRWPEQFRGSGMDYDRHVSEIKAGLKDLVKANKKLDQTTEACLQSLANKADLEYAAFKQAVPAVEMLYEEFPFDPAVQELKEQMDELKQQFPKE